MTKVIKKSNLKKMNTESSLNIFQVKTISSLIIDLGKLFFASGVISFLFPGIVAKTNPVGFVVGLLISIIFFYFGVKLLKSLKETNHD